MSATTIEPVPSLLFTCEETARALRISERTLWSLRKRGELCAVRVGQRGVRYDPRDLQRWIDRQKVSGE